MLHVELTTLTTNSGEFGIRLLQEASQGPDVVQQQFTDILKVFGQLQRGE